MRRGIQDGLLDSSPAVRDAAVELIGKYMIDSPEVAGDYYQKIADRMAVSLAVLDANFGANGVKRILVSVSGRGLSSS